MINIIGLVSSISFCILAIVLLGYHLCNSKEKGPVKIAIGCTVAILSFIFFIHYVIKINEPSARIKAELIKNGVAFFESGSQISCMYNVKVIKKKVVIPYAPDFDYYEIQVEDKSNYSNN